jgi:hypothetical protein
MLNITNPELSKNKQNPKTPQAPRISFRSDPFLEEDLPPLNLEEAHSNSQSPSSSPRSPSPPPPPQSKSEEIFLLK